MNSRYYEHGYDDGLNRREFRCPYRLEVRQREFKEGYQQGIKDAQSNDVQLEVIRMSDKEKEHASNNIQKLKSLIANGN